MDTTSNYRVLLVEDDDELASMVVEFLKPYGFDVQVEDRGDTASQRILTESPDAVVLDVNLPGKDGFSICRDVRNEYSGPVLILTARGEEVDEVLGLEVGADDYMAKPVRPRVLLARLRAHLRKEPAENKSGKTERLHIETGDLVIDGNQRTVQLSGKGIDLTTAEFELLWLLAENAGAVLSRNEIYLRLLGFKYDGLDRSIDLRVSRLRKKLGDDSDNPQRIKSVRGVGYILTVEQ